MNTQNNARVSGESCAPRAITELSAKEQLLHDYTSGILEKLNQIHASIGRILPFQQEGFIFDQDFVIKKEDEKASYCYRIQYDLDRLRNADRMADEIRNHLDTII